MNRFIPKSGIRLMLALLTCCCISARIHAQKAHSEAPLTTVAAVADREISNASYGVPVRLRAQITYVDPEWRILFVRDTTGSIFVLLPSNTAGLNAGNVVEVTGVTAPGDVGSNIVHPRIRWIGNRGLVAPRRVSLAAIEAGLTDSEYVATEGVIRPGPSLWDHTSLTLVDGNVSAPIIIPGGVNRAAEAVIGAHVMVRGVSAVRLDGKNQPIGYQLFVQTLEKIGPENPHRQDPFSTAVEPISAIAGCNLTDRFLSPLHLRGQVLWDGTDEIVLGDDSGTVKVRFLTLQARKPEQCLTSSASLLLRETR